MLLLWDIDGTLLRRAADAHRDAVLAALSDVFGIPLPDEIGVDTGGRTDPEIARLILLRHGIPADRIDERMGVLRATIVAEYARRAPADLSHTVPPGIAELLEDLAAREAVRLSLVTGNLEPIARLKLERAGIGHHFPHGQGAFGSDSESRAHLPEIARRRAGENGRPWPRKRTLLIGDTPRDIACARADGLRVVAVATGPSPFSDLGDADWAVETAPELVALLRELL